MQKSKIDVHPHELPDLIGDMKAGKLQVPRFQRDFVWPLTKTRELLDSMYKEFPIGSFFLWQAPADSPPFSRPLSELGIPAPKPGAEVIYILDGQQRLTSLFAVIYGVSLYGRDYGRICIDLETATRYEANSEDGFDEAIFVHRNPDNKRYVAVCDLIGDQHLEIYDQIPKEWKPVFNKAHRLFHRYPFSVVSIQEQTLGDAIEIFQRINQAGQRLSRYDLICANVWREDFDLRKRIELLNKRFAQSGFGRLHETVYTQAFSLILKDRCTTLAELSLETDDILRVWDRVVRCLELAVEFAVHNLGVKRAGYLPYRGLLVVLSYYFYHAPSSALSAREREALWRWFWRVTLSERYGSTSPSRMAEDALKFRVVMKGQQAAFDYPSKVTAETVAHTKMSSTSSALRNAYICMLALQEPKNLKDGSPVNLADDFFSNLKQAERHHIFPVGYLKSRGWAAASVHFVPNFCFIPADLNKEISSRAPAEYLAQYRQENPQFGVAAESHLLPVEAGAAVWDNDFERFRTERAQVIADELNRLADTKPGKFVAVSAPEAAFSDVGLMEIRLRDFIDHRLAAVLGPHYWKQAMPGDVVTYVRGLTNEYLARHPYQDQSAFAVPRRRLDFCDVSHYEKIILRNWPQFEEYFARKDELQRHLAAYRALRNCVQHNRPPSDIEKQLGETAMKWLGRILDRYDQEVQSATEIEDTQETEGIDESDEVIEEARDVEEVEEIDVPVVEDTIEIPIDDLRLSSLPAGFYGPLQTMVERTHLDVGAEAAERLTSFLMRINRTSLKKRSRKTTYVYRATSWRSTERGKPPKKTLTTVLMLVPEEGKPQLYFPVSWQWRYVVGFDWQAHFEHLKALGGFEDKDACLWFNLQKHNDSKIFEQLFAAIRQIVTDMEDTVRAKGETGEVFAGETSFADRDAGGTPKPEDKSIRVLRVPGHLANEALQSTLTQISNDLPEEAASQLVRFLKRIIDWDWQVQPQTLGVAFRARSLRAPGSTDIPGPMRTTVFFLRPGRGNPHFVFPYPGQLQHIVGFDPTPYTDRLQALGCVIGWGEAELNLFLRDHNTAKMFDQLYSVMHDIVTEMEQSLTAGMAAQ
jgi:hypothetical protein